MAETTGTYVDPYRAYNFKIEIQGATVGHFTECTGMHVKVEPIAYRESGNSQTVHRVPGRVEYNPICLRYGLTSSLALWEWFMTGVKGKVARKGKPTAYVCERGICQLPTTDVDVFGRQVVATAAPTAAADAPGSGG